MHHGCQLTLKGKLEINGLLVYGFVGSKTVLLLFQHFNILFNVHCMLFLMYSVSDQSLNALWGVLTVKPEKTKQNTPILIEGLLQKSLSSVYRRRIWMEETDGRLCA